MYNFTVSPLYIHGSASQIQPTMDHEYCSTYLVKKIHVQVEPSQFKPMLFMDPLWWKYAESQHPRENNLVEPSVLQKPHSCIRALCEPHLTFDLFEGANVNPYVTC